MRSMTSCALAALLVSGCHHHKPPPRDNADLPRTIGHALGGINGDTYTNSREAFELNYGKGCLMLEADLWVTPDHRVVLFHDGQEKDFGLKPQFTSVDFEKARVYGKYTPVDSEALINLFAEHPDWRMVTDVKNDQRQVLTLLCQGLAARGIDCKQRLLPQVYDLKNDYETVRSLGFPRMILTLYRIDQQVTDEQVIDFVRAHPDVVAVTMFSFRWDDSLVAALNALNVKVYVHTVNETLWMQELMKHGGGACTRTSAVRRSTRRTSLHRPDRHGRSRTPGGSPPRQRRPHPSALPPCACHHAPRMHRGARWPN